MLFCPVSAIIFIVVKVMDRKCPSPILSVIYIVIIDTMLNNTGGNEEFQRSPSPICCLSSLFFQSWMASLHKWWTYLKMFGPNTIPSAMGLILLVSSLVATTTRKRHRYLSRSWLVRGSLWTSVFRRRVHSCASLQNSARNKHPDWFWTSVFSQIVQWTL